MYMEKCESTCSGFLFLPFLPVIHVYVCKSVLIDSDTYV